MGERDASAGADPASEGRATYHLLADTPWEQRQAVPAELRSVAAQSAGASARRAQVATGELDLWPQIVEMPAGFVVPPHRHSAHELMVVISGGCTVDGGPRLGSGDMAEFPGGTEYGFTVGDDGIRFVVVRPEASVTHLS